MTTPTLAEVVRVAIESRLSDVHTAIPGIVQKYDAAKQVVEVQPALKRKYAADGAAILLPLLQDVPVLWPRTKQGAIHLPLAKGDSVLLVFSERSIGPWLNAGGVVDPQDTRKHHLSDAVAIPGVWPSTAPIKLDSGDEDRLVIQLGRGKVTVSKDGSVRVGRKGSNIEEPLVLGNVLLEMLTKLYDLLIAGDFLYTTSPGNPTAPNPVRAAELTADKAQYLTSALTNILSSKHFTERGQ